MPSRAQLLTDYLASRPRVFNWGLANCCQFAGAWVRTIEGRDPMAGLRATPTMIEARRLIRELGGSLAAAITLRMGRDPILPTQAQVGDLAIVPLEGEAGAVGICVGMTLVCVDRAGACVHLPMQAAQHAWRVGVSA